MYCIAEKHLTVKLGTSSGFFVHYNKINT